MVLNWDMILGGIAATSIVGSYVAALAGMKYGLNGAKANIAEIKQMTTAMLEMIHTIDKRLVSVETKVS